MSVYVCEIAVYPIRMSAASELTDWIADVQYFFPFLVLLQSSLFDVRSGSGDHKPGLHDSGGRDACQHDLSIDVGARHEKSRGYGSQRPASGHAPRWYAPIIASSSLSD